MMNIKNAMRVGLLTVASLALAAPVFAQDTQDAPPPPAQQHGGPGGYGGPNNPQRQAQMLKRITRELNLTPDQVTQIQAIQADESSRVAALHQSDSSGAPQPGQRKQMMEIRKDGMARTRAVLTDDQKVKYDALLEKQKEREQEHRNGGDGSTPPPPPPPPSL